MIATVTLNPSLDEWVTLSALRLGALNRAAAFARYPGGKGINVSRVVHELGERTVAFALAGGEDGMILRRLMARLGIRHDFVTVSGATRNNYKLRTELPHAFTEINMPGPRVSSQTLAVLLRRLRTHRPRPQCVALCGSLPPGVAPTIYQRWVRVLRRLKTVAVIDASGRALQHSLAARPWLIKPNRQEAEEVLGRRLVRQTQLVRAAQELVRRGAELVILSLGPDGALLAGRVQAEVWWAKPPAVRVESTVGAGDSLVGGFLVGWVRRQPLLEAFRLAVACGTASAMTPGTELCHREDVRRVLSRVTLRRIT